MLQIRRCMHGLIQLLQMRMGATALHFAASSGHLEVCMFSFDQNDFLRRQPSQNLFTVGGCSDGVVEVGGRSGGRGPCRQWCRRGCSSTIPRYATMRWSYWHRSMMHVAVLPMDGMCKACVGCNEQMFPRSSTRNLRRALPCVVHHTVHVWCLVCMVPSVRGMCTWAAWGVRWQDGLRCTMLQAAQPQGPVRIPTQQPYPP